MHHLLQIVHVRDLKLYKLIYRLLKCYIRDKATFTLSLIKQLALSSENTNRTLICTHLFIIIITVDLIISSTMLCLLEMSSITTNSFTLLKMSFEISSKESLLMWFGLSCLSDLRIYDDRKSLKRGKSVANSEWPWKAQRRIQRCINITVFLIIVMVKTPLDGKRRHQACIF